MPTSGHIERRVGDLLTNSVFALLVAVLVFTPIFRAGTTPLSGLISQLLAVALLSSVCWAPSRLQVGRAEAAIIALIVAVPVIFLLPFPADVLRHAPGRDLYSDAMGLLFPGLPTATQRLALTPEATLVAGNTLLLPLSVFLGVRALSMKHIEVLVTLLLAIATLQAVLGLFQYGIGQAGGSPPAVSGSHRLSAVGTYANRNHLAGLIEMALPIALGYMFYCLSRLGIAHASKRTAEPGPFGLTTRPAHAAALYAGIALLLLLAAVFTRSRTGILLAILGLMLCAGLYIRFAGRKRAFGPIVLLMTLGLTAAIWIGLQPVLARFWLLGMESEARLQLFHAGLAAVADVFPLGAGPGAFPWAFSAYQPISLGSAFINHAHNDYLEWLYDLGVFAMAVLLCVAGLYFNQWLKLMRASRGARHTHIQVACGVGILLVSLHGFVDYNLAIPANQIVFALLLSVFLYPPRHQTAAAPGPKTVEARGYASQAKSPSRRIRPTPPRDQIKNPFL